MTKFNQHLHFDLLIDFKLLQSFDSHVIFISPNVQDIAILKTLEHTLSKIFSLVRCSY
jgi:hypothetical protein